MNKYKKQDYIAQKLLKDTGRWTFQVQIRYNNTKILKNFSEKKYGSPRAAYDAAIIYRNKKLEELRSGLFINETQKTIEDCFNESFELLPLTAETKRKHNLILANHIEKDLLIKDLTSEQIQLSLNKMIYDHNNDAIQRVFAVWKRIIKTAIIKKYIAIDLCSGVICPKSQKIDKPKKAKITNKETLDKIIALIDDTNENAYNKKMYKCILLSLYYTGCRPSELFALNKDDINFNNNTITINKKLGSSESQFNVPGKTKTKQSNRIIPFSKELSEVLKTAFKLSKSNILFSNIDRNYYKVGKLGELIRKICKNNNIDFTMYYLRHLFSTDLEKSGVDARTHQELMGHANYTMSINYANSDIELKKNAINNR